MAVFCALLMLGASTAQAAHRHGAWLPHSNTRLEAAPALSGTPGGEEHCQLCQAMHTVLPVAHSNVCDALPLERALLPAPLYELPDAVWQPGMFSRPPPVAGIV